MQQGAKSMKVFNKFLCYIISGSIVFTIIMMLSSILICMILSIIGYNKIKTIIDSTLYVASIAMCQVLISLLLLILVNSSYTIITYIIKVIHGGDSSFINHADSMLS
jgi:ABC-type sugar transport system permease subunit